MLYCIEHEEMKQAIPMRFCEAGHEQTSPVDYEGVVVVELDFCCFDMGWAACPPPELFYTRRQKAFLPTAEEIMQMDQSAVELLTGW